MTEVRPDEDVARELMARALGVPVLRHDDGSRPGMYDIGFTLADGRRGAAEMTSIADPLDRQWRAYARYDGERRIDGSTWAWVIRRRGRPIGLRELMAHLRVLAPLAEERDQTDLDVVVLDPELQHIASVQWFRNANVDVNAFRSTAHPGRVSFTGDNKVAMGDDLHLDPLLDWLEQELTDSAFDADFAKINDSGCEEQHIVLRVDIGNRIPDQVAMALMDCDAILPTRRPAIPGRYLTGLWLIPEFGWSAVCWTVDDGWRRAKSVDPDTHD